MRWEIQNATFKITVEALKCLTVGPDLRSIFQSGVNRPSVHHCRMPRSQSDSRYQPPAQTYRTSHGSPGVQTDRYIILSRQMKLKMRSRVCYQPYQVPQWWARSSLFLVGTSCQASWVSWSLPGLLSTFLHRTAQLKQRTPAWGLWMKTVEFRVYIGSIVDTFSLHQIQISNCL